MSNSNNSTMSLSSVSNRVGRNIKQSGKSVMNKASNARKNVGKRVSNQYQYAKTGYSHMSLIKKVWIVILIALVITILVFWGKSVSNINKVNYAYSPMLVTSPILASNINKNFTVPRPLQGYAFTYSMWIYINDWSYKFGYYKDIIIT